MNKQNQINWLEIIINETGLTYHDFYKKAKLPRSTVSSIIKRNTPYSRVLNRTKEKIAKFLNLTLDELNIKVQSFYPKPKLRSSRSKYKKGVKGKISPLTRTWLDKIIEDLNKIYEEEITQYRLSKISNIPVSTLSHIRLNNTPIVSQPYSNLRILADLLQIKSVDELIKKYNTH